MRTFVKKKVNMRKFKNKKHKARPIGKLRRKRLQAACTPKVR